MLEKPPQPWVRELSLPGDASTRRYARVWDESGHSAILVRYPPSDRGRLPRDMQVRSWCAARGVRVPDLFDLDFAAGWAVLEDFGETDAERALAGSPEAYRHVLAQFTFGPLIRLAELDSTALPSWNPPLDEQRMRWELAGFELWFLHHRLGVAPTSPVSRWLDDLANAVGSQPRRVCHRDYHLNNLFFLPDNEIGVIDYQDMLVGPDTYDAVSLLSEREMPMALSAAVRKDLRETWAVVTGAAPGWRDRWQLVRAQRGLKVLGTFARLAVTDDTPYERWLQSLAGEVAPDLAAIDAPSELVDPLLDLCRHRQPGARRV
jgi:aminoglycoside/choline kinase family phosphotransferase